MARFTAIAALLLAVPAFAQDAVWANTGLEKQGITGQAFQDVGKADIAHCEAEATRAARRAVPVTSPPPGFMQGWRESSRDRERRALERDFMVACMSGKGWALQQK